MRARLARRVPVLGDRYLPGRSARSPGSCADGRDDVNGHFGTHTLDALERSPYEHSDTFVYFIIAEESGLIKIGLAKDPIGRLKILQVGNHEKLSWIGSLAGDHSLEREIHQMFADSRVRGEWFRPSQPLHDLIWAALHAAKGEEAA